MVTRDEETSLALRAAGGDGSARRKVLQQVSPIMLRVIRRVLGNQTAELEDVLQESCFAFLGALGRFRGECSLNHYAGRIAARHAIRARRARQREASKVVALFDHSPIHEEAPNDRGDVHATLRDLLDTIPTEQAESLVLRVVLGHTLPEVAEATGVPVNTVRSRIRLARERLRQMLLKRGVTA